MKLKSVSSSWEDTDGVVHGTSTWMYMAYEGPPSLGRDGLEKKQPSIFIWDGWSK